MPIVTTRYTLLQAVGLRPGTYQSFELARDTDSGATTLVAADLFSGDRTHFDATNAGVETSGTRVWVGGKANGVTFVAPRALNDFVLTFDLNDPMHATYGVNYAITLEVAVVTRDTPAVDAAYYGMLMRLPNPGELDYWNSRFADGRADGSMLRHVIADDSASASRIGSLVNTLYVDFGGRDATGAEVAFWKGRLADGEQYSGVRSAIIDDPLGRGHIAGVVNALYRDFGGRAASAAEVAFWTGEVRGGTTYTGIRTAILDDPLGQGHTRAELGRLYREYFGRDPAASEVAVWDREIHLGNNFNAVAATLALDGGSDGTVRRLSGTSGSDVFHFDTRAGAGIGHVVIGDFDQNHDRLEVNGAVYSDHGSFAAAPSERVTLMNGAGGGWLFTLGEHDTIYVPDVYLNYYGTSGIDPVM